MIREADNSPNNSSDQSGKSNKPWQFQPGQSGNPSGRPKGIRDRRHIVNDLLEAYHRRGGVDFLEELPVDLFTSLIRHLIPKEMDVTTSISRESVAEQVIEMQRKGGRL